MAEIEVQRKRPPLWPWLLGTLAVVLVIAFIVGTRTEPEPVVTESPAPVVPPSGTTGTPVARSAEVTAFLAFSEDPVRPTPSPSHEYTADGIRRLRAALETIIQHQSGMAEAVRDELAAFRASADQIQEDPSATNHAERVREAFTTAASLMSRLGNERWSGDTELEQSIAQVRAAAERVEGDRPLLAQIDAVESFFDHAAEVLRRMTT